MGSTRKVQRGDRLQIPAEAYNAFLDAARAVRGHQHDVLQDAGAEWRQATIVKLKNASGADQDRFAVLALADPIIDPTSNLAEFKNKVNLQGIVPADPCKCQRFAVLLEPLRSAAIGRAVIAGVTPVQINVIRESDPFAEIEPSVTTSLRSVPYGTARILWKESGTGNVWAVIRISDRPRFAVFALPYSEWYYGIPPDQPDGWAYMPNCQPVFYFGDSYSYAADTSEPTETVWHQVGYPPQDRAAVIGIHKTTGVWPCRFSGGDRVWCLWDDHECRWQILDGYEDIWRFELQAELCRLGSADAKLMLYMEGGWGTVDLHFTVHDPLRLVCPCCQTCTSPPARGLAKYFADSQRWELINIECLTSSSSSPPSSASSPSSPSSSSLSSPSSSPSPSSSLSSASSPPSSEPSSSSGPSSLSSELSSLSSGPSASSQPSSLSSEPSSPSSGPSSRSSEPSTSSEPSSPSGASSEVPSGQSSLTPSSEPSSQVSTPSSETSPESSSGSPSSTSPSSTSPSSGSPSSGSGTSGSSSSVDCGLCEWSCYYDYDEEVWKWWGIFQPCNQVQGCQTCLEPDEGPGPDGPYYGQCVWGPPN